MNWELGPAPWYIILLLFTPYSGSASGSQGEQVQIVVVLSPSTSPTVVGTTLGKADPETAPFTTQFSCPPRVGPLEYGGPEQ
jgi:hypothetical protein